MARVVVGHVVRVFDVPEWHEGAPLLYEQEFRPRQSDPAGWRSGMAFRRALENARHMELTFPDRYVEVDCLWEEAPP